MTEDNAVEAVAKAIRKAGKTGSPLENAARAALAAARPIIEREAYGRAVAICEAEMGEVDELSAFSVQVIATAIRRLAEKVG